ncbi:MAG: hypothetical protein O7173_04910, partial [Wolbachia endosymbiont of Nomada fabriciana]|nr:hypothetical protein [Wolbachia endosymbiont of Nomada fabriciana]
GFNIFVCIVLISNTPLFLLFLTYFFKVSGQVLFNTLYKNRESEVSSHLSEVKKVYSPFREPKVVL